MTFTDFKDEVKSFLKKNWFSPFGLLVIWILELLVLLPYLWDNFGEGINKYEVAILIITLGTTLCVWFKKRRYPVNSKHKIGIAVAVTAEHESEQLRLRNDLISKLQEAIKYPSDEQIFNIVEIPDYYASKINNKLTVNSVLNKTKSHFIIFGTCKKRLNGNTVTYSLELEAGVRHKPIPALINDKFRKEFSEIFPRRVQFEEAEELKGFEITKNWISVVTKYVIGIAAYMSGDFTLAFNLLFKLKEELKTPRLKLPRLLPIKTRVNQKLAVSTFANAAREYFLYRKIKNTDHLDRMLPYLELLKEIDPNNYDAHLLRGIYLFLVNRDVPSAKKEIASSRNKLDVTWRYSEAFLFAYENNLDKAEKSYKKAFKYEVRPDILFQTEEFINDVLEVEPEKCQLWYCLGMINWFKKCDTVLGREAFNNFLKCGPAEKFSSQKRKVVGYLKFKKTKETIDQKVRT